LVVDVWYPAEPVPGGPSADYLPDFTALRRAAGEAALRDEFGPAYEALAAGRLRTHSVENAPFARRLGRCPVLIFSHGFGVLSRTYTSQLEDLASHGYVVGAIAHTYETMATVFPDGRAVAFASEPWKASQTGEEASIAYENGRMKWWADDMSFVLDSLELEDRRRPRRAPFAGHVDLRRVGAFGHSAGGRAAALACRNDPRIRACLNQDGLARNLPFDRAAIPGFEQPFLLFTRPRPTKPPTDEELAQHGLTRETLAAFIKELDAGQDAAMESAGRGSYRVTLAMPGMSHDSFIDRSLLLAADDPEKRQDALRNLETIRVYTLAFFDRSLRGSRNTVLDRVGGEATVSVERFPRGRERATP
jgi:pimeloyl-ACP methyl ester carboxylesterase